MTNDKARYFARDLDPTNEYQRSLPCVVRHPDAGGRCGRTATIRMYEMLNFCPEHGEEARIGALMEVYQDANYFFDRLRNPHVPVVSDVVQDELDATLSRIYHAGPRDADHARALTRAYPDTPEYVQDIIRRWELDEQANGGPPALDLLLNSLNTIIKAMRIAHEDREDWLVEILEYQRQEMTARAAFALELAGLRPME